MLKTERRYLLQLNCLSITFDNVVGSAAGVELRAKMRVLGKERKLSHIWEYVSDEKATLES